MEMASSFTTDPASLVVVWGKHKLHMFKIYSIY